VLDDAGNVQKLGRERFWLRNAAKKSIENEMSPIGHEGFALRLAAKFQFTLGLVAGHDSGDGPTGCAKAKAVNLDRQWKTAQRLNNLRAIGDDDHGIGSGGHDLLAQQRAATALDEIEPGVQFVRPVDGDVKAIQRIEVGKGDAK
jgi:hypothetical protein